MRLLHTIPPLFNADSELLILGSFPSAKSREVGFFYGHPQNRFWRVLAAVLGCAVPQTVADKRTFLLTHRIALWDVLAACDIRGSADALYSRYLLPTVGLPAACLPSTSPANAAWSLERLTEAWRVIR